MRALFSATRDLSPAALRPIALAAALAGCAATLLAVRQTQADPPARASTLAKAVAPFVDEDTIAIVHVDLEGTDLNKITEQVVGPAQGSASAKLAVGTAITMGISYQNDLKKAGISEALMVFGAKLSDSGPATEGHGVLLVHKRESATVDEVLSKFNSLVPETAKKDFAKKWVAGNWIALSDKDPEATAKASKLRPVPELTALFEAALAKGRGLHVAFAPQRGTRESLKKALARGRIAPLPGKNVPPPKEIMDLAEMMVDSRYVTMSIVSDPEPQMAFEIAAADAGKAASMMEIFKKPFTPEARATLDADTIMLQNEIFKPAVDAHRIVLAFKAGDGSLVKMVGAMFKGADAAMAAQKAQQPPGK